MGSPRAGSNPARSVYFHFFNFYKVYMYTGSNDTERGSNVGMNHEKMPVGILAILLTLSYLTVIMKTPNRRFERKSHNHPDGRFIYLVNHNKHLQKFD